MFGADSQPIVYEVIAKRIIDAARTGENQVRLRDAGLAALGFVKDGKEAS